MELNQSIEKKTGGYGGLATSGSSQNTRPQPAPNGTNTRYYSSWLGTRRASRYPTGVWR